MLLSKKCTIFSLAETSKTSSKGHLVNKNFHVKKVANQFRFGFKKFSKNGTNFKKTEGKTFCNAMPKNTKKNVYKELQELQYEEVQFEKV